MPMERESIFELDQFRRTGIGGTYITNNTSSSQLNPQRIMNETNSSSALTTMMTTTTSIPVFYNLYVATANDSSRVFDLVSDQMIHLRPEHKPVYIQSMGPIQLSIPNTKLLGHHSNGTEMVTLRSLWNYCTEHPTEKVVYLHSKGSSRNSPENENLRKFLTKGALSRECSTLPTTCNVCSSRFSPLPHPHTSGNMWLAKCDYVRLLKDPNIFETLMDTFTSNCTLKGRLGCDGRGRFSAEHWIHSHPTVKPCDLYANPSFTWDYEGVPPNGTFDIDLAQAPRFDILEYINWHKCAGRGVRLEYRIDEYLELYHQEPDESWWGWNFLHTISDNSWLPTNKKAAKRWKTMQLCWRGLIPKVNKATTKEGRV